MPTEEVIRHRSENLIIALPYEMSYIPDHIRRKAKSELFEDEDTRVHSLRLMRSMLRDEPDLRFFDDDLYLLSFLRARKFDVKRSVNLMKTFYSVVRKREELYANFNFDLVKRTVETCRIGFLPYRDSEGSVILVIQTQGWDPCVSSLGDVMRALTSGLIHANLSPATQISGFQVIFDFGGFTLRHVPAVSPTYLWLFAEALQNCFPGRFRAVHMVNEGPYWSSIWAVLKQFLSKKLKDRFHFHGKNVKKLHKYFSPSILPAEYDGELPPYDNKEWTKTLYKQADFITKVFSYGYGKHRIKSEKN